MSTYNSLLDEMFNPWIDNFDKSFAKLSKAVGDTMEKVTIPMNIIHEEDGSSTIEVAVVGKTREDIKLKGSVEDGKTYLSIESVEQEKSDDDKEAESKRVYTLRKIKGTGKLSAKIYVPANLDIKKLSAKVENGLLTINIPVSDDAQKIEFEIA